MGSLAAALTGPPPARSYTVAGPEATRAAERGLVDGEWFVPPIDLDRLRELSRRQMRRPVLDLVLWAVLLIGSGTAAVVLATRVGWLAALPVFIAYWALYGGACDARWHEFGHGTATLSTRLNDAVYWVASFQALRNPTAWRWSHFRHHSDTIIVGRDAEIQVGRPGTIRRLALNYTGVYNGVPALITLVKQAAGRLGLELVDYVPADQRRVVVRDARISVGLHLWIVAVALATGSVLPLLLVGAIPSMLGAWLMVFFGSTQHLGLAEDVLDHRASTRTVLTNPVFRFLYLNMNYHVEHHVFPTVPYYQLPELHREVAASFPRPTVGMHRAYAEVWRSIRAQRSDPLDVVPDRPIPDVPPLSLSAAAVGWLRPDGAADLGPLDRFETEHLVRVDVADQTFVVVRIGAPGQGGADLCVLDGLCSHGNAHLADGELVVDGEQVLVQCPKHLGRFDVYTGAPCSRPVRVAVRPHEVSIESGHLIARRSTPASDLTSTSEET